MKSKQTNKQTQDTLIRCVQLEQNLLLLSSICPDDNNNNNNSNKQVYWKTKTKNIKTSTVQKSKTVRLG